MADKKTKFKEFERLITLALALATILFIGFLVASGMGNAWMTALYTILGIGICGYCLWLLYKKKELLRQRSFWMTVWAAAIIICTLASLLLNFPSPNLYG